MIEKIGRCDAPVLIEGETGTGKELAARAIHSGSARCGGPFIPVNCGAIPDSLIENELFGHKRGAYTDAQYDHLGLIAHAQKGTLFLDEVDALTPKAQVTLLRFLQDKQYRPLGGVGTSCANVRIITASNADLLQLTEQGEFRRDLLFRLNLMYLKLPPLRDRHGDTVLLANHFLRGCAESFGLEKVLHPDTLEAIQQLPWPGNIRELENFVAREYLLADDGVIRIQPALRINNDRRKQADRRWQGLTSLPFNQAKSQVIKEFERNYLIVVLTAASGNVTQAAKQVDKERRAFGKMLKKYGIKRQQYIG